MNGFEQWFAKTFLHFENTGFDEITRIKEKPMEGITRITKTVATRCQFSGNCLEEGIACSTCKNNPNHKESHYELGVPSYWHPLYPYYPKDSSGWPYYRTCYHHLF